MVSLYNFNTLMNPFSEFILFIIVVLFRKRIIQSLLLLGIAAFILQWFIPEFSLPWAFYLAFVLAGFAWSAFLIDKDLSQAYRELSSQHATEKPDLSISLVQGNEYAYSISDPYTGKNSHMTMLQNTKGMKCHFDERGIFFINDRVYYPMAQGSLEINLQIQNSGKLPLKISSIELYEDLNLNHLRFFNDGILHQGKEFQTPFRLESREVITLQIRYKIAINNGSNADLFAADFQALPKSILHEISVNALDKNREKRTFVSEIHIPTGPLIEIYANQWREYDQLDYLVLSGHSLTDNI